MRLFIAEKPSLGSAIADGLSGPRHGVRGSRGLTHYFVGDDAVTWCIGHVYELFDPEEYDVAWAKWSLDALPLVPKVWRRRAKPEAREQIAAIRSLLAKASVVVHAGDPDREGQLLVDEVLEELGNRKPVRRLWLQATDQASVARALADLRDNASYRALRDSAEARSWGDWLVGMNATRRVTLAGRQAGADGVWSVGRVQTPTLALVVRRDQEVEAFRPKDFFTVTATVEGGGGRFACRWVPGEGLPVDEAGRVVDRALATAVVARLSGAQAAVTRFASKEKTEAQPLPFSLSQLQITCNRLFGMAAQETLEVAQRLYEAKLTSYPRTDCGYLPESQFGEAPAVLAELAVSYPSAVAKASTSVRSPAWNDAKLTAHHGIVPTGVVAPLEGRAALVYDLIVRRYLAQFYPPHRYQETHVELVSEGEKLAAKGRVEIASGWRELFARERSAADPGAEPLVVLPRLAVGDRCRCAEASVQSKKTTPPARHTEASLLAAMQTVHRLETDPRIRERLKETSGIGTPATQAGIIETLKRRGYLELRKKELISTPKGRQLISVLPAELKSAGLTALFEDMLEQISRGQASKADFLARQTAFITAFVRAPLPAAFRPAADLIACPFCGVGHLRKIRGKNGVFWGCSSYRDGCQATAPDAGGKPRLEGARAALRSAP